jgi:hypothetical protein
MQCVTLLPSHNAAAITAPLFLAILLLKHDPEATVLFGKLIVA